MLVIIGIAAAAAASVLLYNHYQSRPDLGTGSTRRAQQLAAVVLVFAKAVEGIVEALSYGMRAEPAMAGRPRQGRLVDMDWEDYE